MRNEYIRSCKNVFVTLIPYIFHWKYSCAIRKTISNIELRLEISKSIYILTELIVISQALVVRYSKVILFNDILLDNEYCCCLPLYFFWYIRFRSSQDSKKKNCPNQNVSCVWECSICLSPRVGYWTLILQMLNSLFLN